MRHVNHRRAMLAIKYFKKSLTYSEIPSMFVLTGIFFLDFLLFTEIIWY